MTPDLPTLRRLFGAAALGIVNETLRAPIENRFVVTGHDNEGCRHVAAVLSLADVDAFIVAARTLNRHPPAEGSEEEFIAPLLTEFADALERLRPRLMEEGP